MFRIIVYFLYYYLYHTVIIFLDGVVEAKRVANVHGRLKYTKYLVLYLVKLCCKIYNTCY